MDNRTPYANLERLGLILWGHVPLAGETPELTAKGVQWKTDVSAGVVHAELTADDIERLKSISRRSVMG